MSIPSLESHSSVGLVIKQIIVPQELIPLKTSSSIVSVATKSTSALQLIVNEFSCFQKVPLPGQMAFNDSQTTYWTVHTSPRVSKKINKLVDLKKIAYAQEKEGVRFEGRRSAAEAEVELMRERLIQSSQAARIHNPLTFATDSIKYLVDEVEFYFQSMPSIDGLFDQFGEPIGNTKFNVRKSTGLSEREAASETISTYGVLLVDSGHTSIGVQNGIKFFLEKHFKPERGDIFLTEAVFVYVKTDMEETVVLPTVDEHHTIFCMGIPLQSCQFFREPENEIKLVLSVMTERRNLVNKIFEFLMNSIAPSKAREARQKLEKRNNEITTADTEFKVKLMIEYQDYCYPAKQQRLSRRTESLIKITEKEKEVQVATSAARDVTYYEQITQAMKQLKPGARLFYTMGAAHCDRLEKTINLIDTFIVDIDISNIKDEL